MEESSLRTGVIRSGRQPRVRRKKTALFALFTNKATHKFEWHHNFFSAHHNFPTPRPTPVRNMYRNTEYYAPQPVRPTETQLFFRRNSCSSAIHSLIIERLECRSSTCHLHLVSAGFSNNFAPVESYAPFTATPQHSSPEAGGSNFLGAIGQAGCSASGPAIDHGMFDTCQYRLTIPTIK